MQATRIKTKDSFVSLVRIAYCVDRRNTHYALRIALLVLFLLAACQSAPDDPNMLRLTGSIEATQIAIVAEVGGRVTSIAVDEGDAVEAGQVVVKFDAAALAVQVKQAQAAVKAAEANLAQIKAGARQEAIDAAQAMLNQTLAERAGAAATYSNTQAIRNNPQQIVAQLDAARSGVKLAEQNVVVMQSRLAEARYWRDFYASDTARHATLDKQIAIAQSNLEAAQAQLGGAKAQVAALEAMRRAPVALQSQVNGARSAYSLTLANVAVATASLADLKAGAALEDVALAEAQLHQAQAQLKLAQSYLSRATLTAPLTGVVAQRSAQIGETLQPGSALLSIMNFDEVKLVVYVPQTDLPRVRLGDKVKVYADAYPAETFEGEVTAIARQAQFSSRDTQAQEDRANVVFAVKVKLLNTDHRLKPGMAGDVVFALK
jgi:HlyD family secretion protein